MNITKWLNKHTTNLKGKRIVVTGATGGLGKELCKLFAGLNANLTLAVRNEKLANSLKQEILNEHPNANIDFISLDLSNKQSVDGAIQELKKYNGIDILFTNAGVYNVPLKKLEYGYNNVFQINFVSPYYMIKKLLPELEKKQNSKCVVVGSIAHNYSKINEEDIDFSTYKKPSKIYGNSKRFLMFSLYELFKDIKGVELSIVHPGITLTNMTNHYPKAINWLVKIGIKLVFASPKKAVLNLLLGAFDSCGYQEWIGPKIFNIWGKPKKQKLKTVQTDESKKIFMLSEEIYNKFNNN